MNSAEELQILRTWVRELKVANDRLKTELNQAIADQEHSHNHKDNKEDLLEALKATTEYISQQCEDDWENRPTHLRIAEQAIAEATK